MDSIRCEYEEIVEERKKVLSEIDVLKENDIVKKYFELCKRNSNLSRTENELYSQIKQDDYTYCNHIWVNVLKDHDEYEGTTEIYCGCIKCGLDEKILYLMEYNPNYNSLTQDEKIMYDYMQDNYYNRGIHSKVFCNLDLAMSIYKKIKEKHPNIDDKTALKYFEIALDNIRNIKVNDERKEDRAKRLSLSTKFNKWN